MRLIIYEDETFDNFYPLTYLRATFELRCGATTMAEKLQRVAPWAPVAYFAREGLAPLLRERLDAPVNDPASLRGDDLLLVNGRLLLLDAAQFPVGGADEILACGGTVIGARVSQAVADAASADTPAELLAALAAAVPTRQVVGTVISFMWELIHHNPAAIVADFRAAGHAGIVGTFSDHATVWGSKEQVYVAPTAEVHPFVCIDTKGGPVTIDEGAVVHPHTRIEGPCYIGRGTIIVGGKIREGCSFGPVCRVGGEVEESIIHGYSNKYHDGFLGHAYVCEWVNLGALTTNSDLKNDYSTVQVYLKGELTDTGDTKVGCFIGDHTKTSIGTILNTGTVVGLMCNVMATGSVSPKFIPSFVTFLNGKFINIAFKATMATARTAMSRRKRTLSDAEAAALDAARALTKPERDKCIRRSREHGAAE